MYPDCEYMYLKFVLELFSGHYILTFYSFLLLYCTCKSECENDIDFGMSFATEDTKETNTTISSGQDLGMCLHVHVRQFF